MPALACCGGNMKERTLWYGGQAVARTVAGLAAGACRWRDERACGDQSALANEPGGMQQANTALNDGAERRGRGVDDSGDEEVHLNEADHRVGGELVAVAVERGAAEEHGEVAEHVHDEEEHQQRAELDHEWCSCVGSRSCWIAHITD